MKKRTRISILTRRTIRVEETSLRCPECGAEVPVVSAGIQTAATVQVQELMANSQMDTENSVACEHLLTTAITENKD